RLKGLAAKRVPRARPCRLLARVEGRHVGYEGERVSALGDPALSGETLDQRVEAFGRQIQRRADLLAWCPRAKRRSPVCRRERAFHSYRKRIERVAREERHTGERSEERRVGKECGGGGGGGG